MKYLSLFTGIGGFELGIENAFKNNQSKTERLQAEEDSSSNNQESLQGASCIGYSEIDKYALQIFRKHYPKLKNYGDTTKIDTEQLPSFDLLVGGFPCQAFSIAGKRGGFDDTRGTLFFEIARILRDKQPKHFLLENVKGLLHHDEGSTFHTIIGVLTDLGYRVEWQVLNSKHFGVPQNRERVFIVGHLRGECRRKVFPIGESNKEASELQGQQVTGAITARRGTAQSDGDYIVKGDRKALPVLTPDRPKKRQNGRRFKEDGEPAFTLTGQDRHGVMIGSTQENAAKMKGCSPALTEAMGKGGGHIPMQVKDMKIRRLTPTECERLQGFPDGWTEKGIDKEGNKVEISDTQRYKTLGNAVTTNVISAIIENFDCLD